ncbi:MAG: TonB-dependent receptor, partial [Candidatus Competibacteraceae bacterium]|nr:TonB-dependent receptor [Candidatus Competibacteraceae bacterium]
MHHNRILPLLAACTLAVPALAQDELLTITVTGTRTPRPLEETLVPTTVITREEIDNSAAQSVPELLQGRAGVDLINQGGRGKNTSLFLRGTNAEHVLLLVDGVRLGSATSGQPAFQHLPLEEIERIEIIRGPRSALYGSDAIGGVIQVFTRRGGEGQRVGGRVGYGTYDSREVALWAEGGRGNSSYALSASHFNTEGFEATTPDNFSFEPDDDGYQNNALSLRGGHRFANGLEVAAHALRAQGTTEFDGGAQDSEDDFLQQVLGLDLEYSLTQSWTTSLQLAESRDESEGEDFFFDTRRLSVYWQNDVELTPDQLLTLGVDWYEDQVDSSTAFARTEAEQTGLYGQYQGWNGPHQWLAGLRWEDTDAFGSETTGNLGYGYEINPQLELTLSYGTGFKTPTFNDLFFPDVGFFRGNPDLEPETSESFEVGLQGYHDRGYWRASAFYTEIDDIIVFSPTRGT